MLQFIYILRLIPRLIDDLNWTNVEYAIVEKHSAYLEGLLKEGRLVLAGRTLDNDDKKFGIVIFEAETYEQAEAVLLNDPAIKAGIMQAELHPYRVAFLRNY